MSYATVEDLQARMTRTLSEGEQTMCHALLEDAAVIIDSYNREATEERKKVVSCRMVLRMIGDGSDMGTPIGATQGTISALGYSQSWSMGGGVGELFLSKLEKKLLNVGNRIGSRSPVEDLTAGVLP